MRLVVTSRERLRMKNKIAWLILVGLGLLVGCGESSQNQSEVKISGFVQQSDGQPLRGGWLLHFHVQSSSDLANDFALVVNPEDGLFSGTCFPGKYVVTIESPPVGHGGGGAIKSVPGEGKSNGSDRADKLPLSVRSEQRSPWRNIEITEKGNEGLVLRIP